MSNKYNKLDIELLLKSEDQQACIDALMYITFNFADHEWIQEKCIEQINSAKNSSVKELAVTCLGHTARIHKTINKERTIPLLLKLLKNNELSGQAQDALDDIEHFTNCR